MYLGSLLCRALLKVTTFDCMFNRQFSEMYVNIKFTICFTYLVRVTPELWCSMLLHKSIKYALYSSRHGTLLGILQISGRRFA